MMRKFKGFLGAALLLGAASAAYSQSSVTIYGRVVAGVNYQTNLATGNGQSENLLSMSDSQWLPSILGFTGTEDLGGGLQGFFTLESGFSAKSGAAGGLTFNRRSYVGLRNSSWGSLTLGNNITVSDHMWWIDPAGQQWTGSASLVRGRNWLGNPNQIWYQTPNWGGFSAQVMTSLGEQAGSNSKGRTDAFVLNYAKNNLDVRAVYDQRRDKDGRFSDLFNYSKELTIGGTYTIDKVKLYGAYQRIEAPQAVAGSSDKLDHFWLGARYQATPALTLIGAAYRVQLNKNNGNANLFLVGGEYSLSKRTLLFASLGTVRNSDKTNFAVQTYGNPNIGQSQVGFYSGISHSF